MRWACAARSFTSRGEPRLRGTLLQDTLKHIHVSLDTRLPASYGPEVRYRTPSALCINYKAMASNRTNTLMAEAGAGIVLPGPYEAGSRG